MLDLTFSAIVAALLVLVLAGGLTVIAHRPGIRLVAALSVGAMLVGLITTWQLSKSRELTPFCTTITHGPAQPVVALTFDDGPTPTYTDPVLDLLNAYDAKATFFVTGAELSSHPELGERILMEGHELGNHSWSHPRMVFRSNGFVRDQVERTDVELGKLGVNAPLFRPPYGKLWGAGWAIRGRTIVNWSMEPESNPTLNNDPEELARYVLDNIQPGDIVLLHVMYASRENTRRALPIILAGLKDRELETVTVSELLALEEEVASTAQVRGAMLPISAR